MQWKGTVQGGSHQTPGRKENNQIKSPVEGSYITYGKHPVEKKSARWEGEIPFL